MNQEISESNLNSDLIWKQIMSDDVNAFQMLFNAFYENLVSYSHRFTQQQVISEEIVQDVFISLWERRRKITIQSSLKSYLYRAVKNRTINYVKNQLPKDQVTTDLNENLTITESNDEPGSETELKEAIDKAVSHLPDKCRTIFLLSRGEGLTHKEIAAELDISTKTVENQIGIAIKKLRTSLKPFLNSIVFSVIFKIVLNIFWGFN
ncbi:MAG: RNA polymerase sigma-70 factor [Bacteroidota bacterium]